MAPATGGTARQSGENVGSGASPAAGPGPCPGAARGYPVRMTAPAPDPGQFADRVLIRDGRMRDGRWVDGRWVDGRWIDGG